MHKIIVILSYDYTHQAGESIILADRSLTIRFGNREVVWMPVES